MIFIDEILQYIALHLSMRNRAIIREVCIAWRNTIRVSIPVVGNIIPTHDTLHDLLLNAAINPSWELIYKIKSSHEKYPVKIPALDNRTCWNNFGMFNDRRDYHLRWGNWKATKQEALFIRHIIAGNISKKYVLPLLSNEQYLSWYIQLTRGDKCMCLRLPHDIRAKIMEHYNIEPLDILLHERRQQRLAFYTEQDCEYIPWDFGGRNLIYQFNTLDIGENAYILYILKDHKCSKGAGKIPIEYVGAYLYPSKELLVDYLKNHAENIIDKVYIGVVLSGQIHNETNDLFEYGYN